MQPFQTTQEKLDIYHGLEKKLKEGHIKKLTLEEVDRPMGGENGVPDRKVIDRMDRYFTHDDIPLYTITHFYKGEKLDLKDFYITEYRDGKEYRNF